MGLSRQDVCRSAGKKLAAASPRSIRALIGLDGFVDEIIAVVDKRQDKDRYDAIPTIKAFGEKIHAASGQSSNYELVVRQTKLGGNGPIMANALAGIGMEVTYIGNLGYPAVHPVFADFAKRARVISIAEPGHTDALEFGDGKLMLGKHESLKDVNWENLVSRVGASKLRQLIESSHLIGMVNWTMLPHMSQIWAQVLESEVQTHRGQRLFVDLADPEKRTHEDILEALKLLGCFQEHVDVTLGLNLKESSEVAQVLGLPVPADAEADMEATARAIRAKLSIECVVIHPRRGAAAATAGASAAFAGPFVQAPKISTGAGDHFNAGFCTGRVLGLTLEESLAVGVAASGYYVRTAQSPTARQLAEFLAELPGPEV